MEKNQVKIHGHFIAILISTNSQVSTTCKTPPPSPCSKPTNWQDYELLDSGDGLKLERFGKYIFARPESQAMWSRALSQKDWDAAHAVFQPTAEESGGHWDFKKKKVDEKWEMRLSAHPNPLPKARN